MFLTVPFAGSEALREKINPPGLKERENVE